MGDSFGFASPPFSSADDEDDSIGSQVARVVLAFLRGSIASSSCAGHVVHGKPEKLLLGGQSQVVHESSETVCHRDRQLGSSCS